MGLFAPVGDTRDVPSAEGGNGGTICVRGLVLGDWDEDLNPQDWWVVSQGFKGERGRKGKKGEKTKREKEGAPSRPGELLFRTRR